ncbi:MAG: hypothetical protein ABR577_07935 [Pyrinomonadaceae bacterium]
MKRRKIIAIPLLLCCALGGGAMWLVPNTIIRGQSQANAPAIAQASNPLAGINDKLRTAKGGGEAAARALADDIFSRFDFDQAPAGMTDAIKERLVRAELNYRKGRGKAISELSIARMINRLAFRLDAPAYGRTNLFEVKRFEAGLIPYTPELRAQLRAPEAGNGKSRRASADRTMSPLEATFVAGLLLQQKRFNAEYQLTNDEWIALHGGKRGSKLSENFREEMSARRNDAKRTTELEQAAAHSLTAMHPSQILNLPMELLDTLGVER